MITIVNQCRQGNFTLAGLDIMEINKHSLGLELADGTKDNTLELIKNVYDLVWGYN